mmetsp:Transcript_35173/g.100213  ORF Transcript_35173/g.100213 Transcript_35173/m.100213 type:complete len:280 (-) Transcript_35173:823-1662(-)
MTQYPGGAMPGFLGQIRNVICEWCLGGCPLAPRSERHWRSFKSDIHAARCAPASSSTPFSRQSMKTHRSGSDNASVTTTFHTTSSSAPQHRRRRLSRQKDSHAAAPPPRCSPSATSLRKCLCKSNSARPATASAIASGKRSGASTSMRQVICKRPSASAKPRSTPSAPLRSTLTLRSAKPLDTCSLYLAPKRCTWARLLAPIAPDCDSNRMASVMRPASRATRAGSSGRRGGEPWSKSSRLVVLSTELLLLPLRRRQFLHGDHSPEALPSRPSPDKPLG